MMENASQIARQICGALGALTTGTLRLFGAWLGNPAHTVHKIVGAHSQGACLVVEFARGETLSVWDPEEFRCGQHEFRIGKASRVRWEWHAYGVRYPARERFYRDYSMEGTTIHCRSNFPGAPPKFDALPAAPVIELLHPWDTSAVTESLRIADRINDSPGKLKAGSLRLFGCTPTAPFDGIYRVVSASCSFQTLIAQLSDGSTLMVWEPEGYQANDCMFRIAKASWVRWEQRPPQARRTLAFRTYVQRGADVECWSGFGQYDFKQPYDPHCPAVELV